MRQGLDRALVFQPVYQTVVWGGERIAKVRGGPSEAPVPAGPVGEAWDLADHPRGMSVVAHGPLAGHTLGALTREHPEAVVGPGFPAGQAFPLMVKLIDARDRLSVQVHPGDALAAEMGLADGGKTECWWVVGDGGELFVGTAPGVDAPAFELARASGTLGAALRRFEVRRGDFVYLPAGTVHAIGAGCLLLEVQQTSDNTFRVDDWGRLGLDGKPRPLHVEASRRAARFDLRPDVRRATGAPRGRLVDGPAFTLDEVSGQLPLYVSQRCAVVVAVEPARIVCPGGAVHVPALGTALIPAAAGHALLTSGLSLVGRPR